MQPMLHIILIPGSIELEENSANQLFKVFCIGNRWALTKHYQPSHFSLEQESN